VAGASVLLALTVLRRPVPRHVPASDAALDPAAGTPASLWNRLLVAALVVNLGSYFAVGTYDVIWSLWMTRLGADIGLVGLTFAAFGLGVVVISPLAGRWSDRHGPVPLIVLGTLGMALAGTLYPALANPVLVVPVVIFEGVAEGLLGPALYAVVARGTPAGRSATAQGVFGAAGTLGTMVAAVVAGTLFARDVHLPFYTFVVVILASLAVGLAIGRNALRLPATAAASGEVTAST
jgi:NNP family nitrate/nitrite transporter-like MFS transporter